MAHFPKPAAGSWTENYPELGTAPVDYTDSIDPAFFEAERNAIFHAAKNLDASFFGGGEHFGEDIEVPVIRGAGIIKYGMGIESWMWRGEIAAVKIQVVFLFTVIAALSSLLTSSTGIENSSPKLGVGWLCRRFCASNTSTWW